jgi:hypothetical protein
VRFVPAVQLILSKTVVASCEAHAKKHEGSSSFWNEQKIMRKLALAEAEFFSEKTGGVDGLRAKYKNTRKSRIGNRYAERIGCFIA